ncbi:hypothetical protein ACN1C3_30205 [Pseudomonas sp. H11T01]|uniref:hypothetical protein n=1 Tax=Pseudomonas sp. H11T01 TaxID=3402749 RepID=UPI003AC21231
MSAKLRVIERQLGLTKSEASVPADDSGLGSAIDMTVKQAVANALLEQQMQAVRSPVKGLFKEPATPYIPRDITPNDLTREELDQLVEARVQQRVADALKQQPAPAPDNRKLPPDLTGAMLQLMSRITALETADENEPVSGEQLPTNLEALAQRVADIMQQRKKTMPKIDYIVQHDSLGRVVKVTAQIAGAPDAPFRVQRNDINQIIKFTPTGE